MHFLQKNVNNKRAALSCTRSSGVANNNDPDFFFSSLVSIIRGQVLTADGTPLIGVNVSFVHYPEHGYTVTRKDGMCVYNFRIFCVY